MSFLNSLQSAQIFGRAEKFGIKRNLLGINKVSFPLAAFFYMFFFFPPIYLATHGPQDTESISLSERVLAMYLEAQLSFLFLQLPKSIFYYRILRVLKIKCH